MLNKNDKIFIQKIVDEYNSGVSARRLNAKYHIQCEKILKSNTAFLSNHEFNKKDRFNRINLKWKFESVSNEIEAYILGIWLSDGCVYNNQLKLKLKESDKDLLTNIKNYFSNEIKITKDKKSYSFCISSKLACENAKNFGIIPNKTFSEIHVPKIDDDLIRHFIRGYFDGDGSVFVCKRKTPYLKLNICSPTIAILKEIQYILNKYNIDSAINIENRIGKKSKTPNNKISICKNNMYRLYVRKKESIKNFYKFIYKDSIIYLKRKKDIFDNFYSC